MPRTAVQQARATPAAASPRPSGLRSIGRPPHQLLQLFPGIPINLVDWQRRFSEE
ncbi:hypothetical protein [Chloracidobacterium aggregatum]|uniref:hypothetical protein n=1 Tax=Chloracidobacterium aggregatum TaxID=2851959 RepID=UPI001B8CCF56|nr:hypothetical protein [Chloracidobacterium aggregatum]QUV98574.1 hypothetical protein J8C00_12095 [Chloracidobacterium sp. E]